MKVVVTGGAGFIGSHLVDALIASGHEVAVIDNLATGSRGNVHADATLFEVDVRDHDAVCRVLDDWSPDVVSHQAAQGSVPVSVAAPVEDAQINLVGTVSMLEASRRAGVRRFVFASTGGAIYGEVPPDALATEDGPLRPLCPYAAAKLSCEQYIAMYERLHGLKATILRYANVYGPRQTPEGEAGVVSIFSLRMLAGQSVNVYARRDRGDGGGERDYVFIEDVVTAHQAAVASLVDVPIMNVCTGVGTTTIAIARSIESALGIKAEIIEADRRPGDLERAVLDPTRLRAVIKHSTPLVDGIQQTVAWFQAQAT